jgi:hypothetical protein
MVIRLPKLITPYPDRDLDCQEALEGAFIRLVDLAHQSGWTRTETIEAMRELAFNLLYMEEEITKTDSQIASLKGDLTKH